MYIRIDDEDDFPNYPPNPLSSNVELNDGSNNDDCDSKDDDEVDKPEESAEAELGQ